jgi:4-hydroxy-tetrahydrodipicolinate reductase
MGELIAVVVHGALGRMGQEVLNAVCLDPQLRLVGAVDLKADSDSLPLPNGSGEIPFTSNLESLLEQYKPHVLVDFSTAEAAIAAVTIAVKHKVNLVIGTTGLKADDFQEVDRNAIDNGVGVFVAPNFAMGAVMMVHYAKIAAKFFDYVEIIELHHEQKADAPSGTAISTANAMLEARGKPFSYAATKKETLEKSRGGELEGIALHSIRLPGLMAHQEVILGASGRTLTIRHDTINRQCYMPGVIMAIKKVIELKGLTFGLDKLMGLS